MSTTLSSQVPARRTPGTTTGLVAALVAAAAFGSSGAFAKVLLDAGWTPGSAVFVRILGAALLLLGPTLVAMRGRWGLLRTGWHQVVVYGAMAVALPQLAFFLAVQTLPVGVALLLEYLGLVLVVVWLSLVQRRLPSRAILLGVALALGGLALVLDLPAVLGSGAGLSLVGVAWGLLAAVGLASFFLLSSPDHEASLPPLALAGLGLVVAALLFGVLGLVGVLPMTFATTPVQLGATTLPWWVAVLELAVVAAATAYVAGIVAARLLGPTVASFLGLAEVLFAVLFAWVLLAELPTAVQLVGGVLILAGVVVVRLEQVRRDRTSYGETHAAADGPADGPDRRPGGDAPGPPPDGELCGVADRR